MSGKRVVSVGVNSTSTNVWVLGTTTKKETTREARRWAQRQTEKEGKALEKKLKREEEREARKAYRKSDEYKKSAEYKKKLERAKKRRKKNKALKKKLGEEGYKKLKERKRQEKKQARADSRWARNYVNRMKSGFSSALMSEVSKFAPSSPINFQSITPRKPRVFTDEESYLKAKADFAKQQRDRMSKAFSAFRGVKDNDTFVNSQIVGSKVAAVVFKEYLDVQKMDKVQRAEYRRRNRIARETRENAKKAGMDIRTLLKHPSVRRETDLDKWKKSQAAIAQNMQQGIEERDVDRRVTIDQLSRMSGSFDDLADQFGRDEAVEAKVFWKAVSRIRENPEVRESREKFAEELKKRTGAGTFMEAYKKILEDNKDLLQSLKTDLLFADYDYEDIKDQINSSTIIL